LLAESPTFAFLFPVISKADHYRIPAAGYFYRSEAIYVAKPTVVNSFYHCEKSTHTLIIQHIQLYIAFTKVVTKSKPGYRFLGHSVY